MMFAGRTALCSRENLRHHGPDARGDKRHEQFEGLGLFEPERVAQAVGAAIGRLRLHATADGEQITPHRLFRRQPRNSLQERLDEAVGDGIEISGERLTASG